MSETTPERYQADPRPFDDKDWLYERYWGAMSSTIEIAAECDVSDQRISRALREHGIPTRAAGWEAAGNPLKGLREFDDREPSVDWSEVAGDA